MKIKAYFNRIDLDHKDFSHLEYKEKKEIETLMLQGRAIFAEIKKGNKHIASVIFTREGDSIHAREIAGNFPEVIKFIDALAQGLAKCFNLPFVTFCFKRDAVKRIGLGLGYKTTEYNPNEMFKAI